jgi:hypothetical protein
MTLICEVKFYSCRVSLPSYAKKYAGNTKLRELLATEVGNITTLVTLE